MNPFNRDGRLSVSALQQLGRVAESSRRHIGDGNFYTTPGGAVVLEPSAAAAAVNLAWVKATSTTSTQVNLGRTITDGVITGAATLTSATANFTSADTGSTAIGTGIPANTTITFVNSTTATLSNASTNGSGLAVQIVSGTTTGYAAVLSTWSNTTGAWTDGTAVWLAGVNTEAAQGNLRYQCRLLGADDLGVQIWGVSSELASQAIVNSGTLLASNYFDGNLITQTPGTTAGTAVWLTGPATASTGQIVTAVPQNYTDTISGSTRPVYAFVSSGALASNANQPGASGGASLTAGSWTTDPNTSIVIPSAGVYILFLTVSVEVDQPKTGEGSVEAVLYDITNAVQISPSVACTAFNNNQAGTNQYGVVGSGTILWPYTASGTATVGFQTFYSSPGGSGGSAAVLYTLATAVRCTSIGYVKIG